MTGATLISLVMAASSPFNATFDRAVEAYQARDYAGAATLFEQLVDEGVVDASVFYNLGNAYYRLDRLGPAIANYERALRHEPGFEMAARNLAQCVLKTKRQLGRPIEPAWHDRALFWQNSLSTDATRALAVFFWFALWLLLGIRVLAPLRYLRRAAAVSAVLAVAFGWSAWAQAHPAAMAVAARPEVVVRAGVDDSDPERARLREGDRVLVERREYGWARVRSALGERGWVRDETLAWVGPPYERPVEPVPETAP